MQNDYIDTNTSITKGELVVDPSVFNYKFPAYFSNNTVYKVDVPSTLPYFYYV